MIRAENNLEVYLVAASPFTGENTEALGSQLACPESCH